MIQINDNMKRVYLACPYSGMEDEVFHDVTELAGVLMQLGYAVYSPITHCHPIQEKLGMDFGHSFWLSQCKPFLEMADEIFVFTADGWEESIGVNWEINFALSEGKSIHGVVFDRHDDYSVVGISEEECRSVYDISSVEKYKYSAMGI